MRGLLFFTLIINHVSQSKPVEFSACTHLYLLTVSNGDNVDQSWGHSAVWFHDETRPIDFVFEYTSVEDSNLSSTIKAILGRDSYKLSVTNFRQFKQDASKENQSVDINLVDTSAESTEKIYYILKQELLNRKTYHYKIAYQNCSSLLYDHLKTVVKNNYSNPIKSYRSLFRSDAVTNWFYELLIFDLLSSHNSDQKTFSQTYITPLSLQRKVSNNKHIFIHKSQRFRTVSAVFITITTLFIPVMFFSDIVQRTLLLFTGLAGIPMLTIFMLSEEFLFRGNHQIIYLNPLSLIIFFLPKRIEFICMKAYFIAPLFSSVFSMVNGHFNPISTLVFILSTTYSLNKLLNQTFSIKY